ncbi:MAG: HTH-type transcriptional repressor AseR [Syntrophorhabdaceae bacterium PtaU1.Bin034]|nr:MAG: HTH-type transcriptional repressor AseR [Syntrophorhabdaceae bacterium PtaU1.Bin034]
MNDLITVFRALSDETHIRIIKLLEQGELCVCEIVAAFGVGQPRVSFHLAALKNAGLVRDRKEGKWMYYRIDDSDLFKRFLILSVLEKIPEETFREDRERLEGFRTSALEAMGAPHCCGSVDVRRTTSTGMPLLPR